MAKFIPMPHKAPDPDATVVGRKRPAIRSMHDIKNFMLESIELHATGLITANDLRARTTAAKDTAEVHAALKLMDMQGITFDMEAQATGLDYKSVTRRTVTRRRGVTIKGPIEEEIHQEIQEASPASSDGHDGRPPSLADRLAFGKQLVGGVETGNQDDDDEIPW